MPESRTLPVGDEHARPADRPVYPGRHRGRRLLGVDAYGFAHYRAGDWVEIVRHAAVVGDGDDGGELGKFRGTAGRDRDDARYERPDGRGGRATSDGDTHDPTPTVETDLATVHEVPLHLVGVSLDEYLRSVGDYLGPVAEQGFEPVEGADPDRWEWVSPYARRWVEAFGEDGGPARDDDSTADEGRSGV